MSIYAHIKRCLELADRDIASAVADRRMAKALLDQLAKVSRPGDGAPKLLLVFARLASSEVDWIDGALRVEMVGDADVTVVEVLSELGLGMHERVFPSFKMSVPLEEFARAVERVPHMIAPLTIATASARRLVLTAAEEEEQDEDAPASPAVSIGDDSLYVRRSSKDKLAAVKDPGTRIEPRAPSSAKVQQVRKVSKSDPQGLKPHAIPARTGKTLRPAPPAGDAPAKAAAPPGPAPGVAPPPLAPSVGRIAAGPPGASTGAMRIARAPGLPKSPPLPRTDEHTPAPGPAPGMTRSVVAKVPLTRIQVPRSSPHAAEKGAPQSRPSKHPKRVSVKPPKGQSKPPPDRRSKGPPPKSIAPKATRGRSSAGLSEPPDEEGIDMGWDDNKNE